MSFSEWKDYSNLRPLGNRVLVKRLPLPEVRESGLFVIGRDYPTMGLVLAIGNGTRVRKFHFHELNGPQSRLWLYPGDRRPVDYLIRVGDKVQWSIDTNFDLKQIGRTSQGEDLFLFDYNDLNFVGREE